MLKIIVTGAAGLIGAEVCARLVARGHRVTALVRRNRQILGNDGQVVPVTAVVSGDVREPHLCLNTGALDIDLIIHCAASLEFDAAAADLHAVNVAGTINALELARTKNAGFLHISTAYVCGQRSGPILEAAVPAGTHFANGYEASKAAAEEAVRASGIPFAIARPSITLGHSQTGQIRQFPSLCNLVRLMARGRISALPVSAPATLDMVPIDHVAAGIVRIAERMDAAQGGTFHLTSGSPLSARKMVHAIARKPHFSNPIALDPSQFDPANLPSKERPLSARVLATFGSYLQCNPQFCDEQALALTGLARPETGHAWFEQLIHFAISSGYLPPASTEYRALTEYPDSGAPTGHASLLPIESPA